MNSEPNSDQGHPPGSGEGDPLDGVWDKYAPPEEASLDQGALTDTPKAELRPWGPWATIGWTALIMTVMVVVQTVVLIGFMVANGATQGKEIQDLASSSLLLSTATLVSTPLTIGLVMLLIYARGNSIPDYLALRWPSVKQAGFAIVSLLILVFSGDVLTYLLGRPIAPEVMINVYRTGWFPLLLLTLVVAAPLGEEVIFRGFFYRGIAASRWGPSAAIGLSAFLWAIIHIQYDFYTIAIIVLMGIFLGDVRRRTDSLPLTMILHGISNAIATIEMIVMDRMSRG